MTHTANVYEKNALFGFRYKPLSVGWYDRSGEIDNQVIINSQGFHDIEHSYEEKSEPYRIMVLGDSFTAGIYLQVSQTWTQIFSKQLSERMGAFEVMNLGLDGTGTNVHLAMLKHYAPLFKPDCVLLAFYQNDFSDAAIGILNRECYKDCVLCYKNEADFLEVKKFIDTNKPGRIFTWMFHNLYIVRAIANPFKNASTDILRKNWIFAWPKGEPWKHPVNNKEMDFLFQELINYTEHNGIKLLVVPVPNKLNIQASQIELIRTLSKKTLEQLSIIDLNRSILEQIKKDKNRYEDISWQYDWHLNVYGNKVFGEKLAEVFPEDT